MTTWAFIIFMAGGQPIVIQAGNHKVCNYFAQGQRLKGLPVSRCFRVRK